MKTNAAINWKMLENISDDLSIGDIGNSYGGLSVKEEDGKFYWSIEDHVGTQWQEIPESLYLELMMIRSK